MKEDTTQRKSTSAKVKDISYWRKMNKAWESSGVSKQKFCAANDLNPNALTYWRKKLLREGNAHASHHDFIPVVMKASQSMTSVSELKLSLRMPTGHILSFPSTLDENTLSKIFKILGVNHA